MKKSGSRSVKPARTLDAAYLDAFTTIVVRIQSAIATSAPRGSLPIAMFVAGGAAQFFYTGARVSTDIDATFSRRLLLPDDLEVVYRDADGGARALYFDRQYNDTFALLHEDVYTDSRPLELSNVDAAVIEVRLLAPVDLAVSKLARFAEHDQADIAALAAAGLITAQAVRRRAEEAVVAYVGNLASVRTSIELACALISKASHPNQH